MSSQLTQPLPLDQAEKIAKSIVEALQPYCDKIEIAGSIRRRRPFVNDIDLVVIPHPGQLPALKARALQRCTLVTGGDQNFIVRLPERPGSPTSGFQIDIFIARAPEPDLLGTKPGNWGTMLLNRTGSRDHNIWLVTQAERRGMRWHPYQGLYGPNRNGRTTNLASETEEEIYAALGLPFVDPINRESNFLRTLRTTTAAALQQIRTPNAEGSKPVDQAHPQA